MFKKLNACIVILLISAGFCLSQTEESQYVYLKDILENLKKKEKESPIEGDLALEVAYVYLRIGKFEEAINVLKKELNLHPADDNARLFLAIIYFKSHRVQEAAEEFRIVVEIDEWDAMGHYNLGSSYYALQDWKNAEREWKEAIEYEGKQIKDRKKEDIISEDELSISLEVRRKPVSFRAHKSLGWMYLHQGQKEKALKEFLKAIELAPGDAEPYFEVGKIYKEKGEKEKAIFYLEKYLYLGGKKEEEAKKLLELLKEK